MNQLMASPLLSPSPGLEKPKVDRKKALVGRRLLRLCGRTKGFALQAKGVCVFVKINCRCLCLPVPDIQRSLRQTSVTWT